MHAEQLFQKTPVSPSGITAEQEPVEDRGSYGVVPAVRERAAMVELQKRDGEMLAIPYTLMEKVMFKPDIGITIQALGTEIRIKGRHLHLSDGTKISLFSGLCRHRVAWIRENPRSLGADMQAAVIESIAW